jgi:hypothetical protein
MEMSRRSFGALALASVGALALFGAARTAVAVEAGQPAPDFKLPATTGSDIALSDYRGKKWVLLEFYGADFAPT